MSLLIRHKPKVDPKPEAVSPVVPAEDFNFDLWAFDQAPGKGLFEFLDAPAWRERAERKA